MIKLIIYLHFITPQLVYEECVKQGVLYPDIVTRQSILETGWYKHYKNSNIFGLYDSNKHEYFKFDHWRESVVAYRDLVQYKYKGDGYYKFLINLPYATDKNYINKLKGIKWRK